MDTTRANRSVCFALVAGFALGAAALFSGIQVAAADTPIATRDVDARAHGRGSYYPSHGSASSGVVLTRANGNFSAESGRSSVYATPSADSGTIIGAADRGRAVFSRPDPARPGRQ